MNNSLIPEQIEKIKQYTQSVDGEDERDAFFSLQLYEWDLQKAIQTTLTMRNEQRLKPHFDVCLFHFSNLHSWYNFGSEPVYVTLVPVLGHEQEYDGRLPPCVPEDGVSWHFMLENREADYKFPESPEAQALESFLAEQRILVPEGRDIYFGRWKSSLLNRLPPGPFTNEQKNNLQRNALAEHIEFGERFVHFQTFYQQCKDAKDRIISFLGTQHLQQVLPRFHTNRQVVVPMLA